MNIYDLFDPNTVRRLYRIKGASLRFIGQCVVIFTDTELLLTRVQFILAICSIMLGDKEQAGAKADGNCRWDLCRLSTINVLRELLACICQRNDESFNQFIQGPTYK